MRAWLRELRINEKLSELEVARRAEIAQPFYHNIEMGIKNPSVDTSKRIAKVLHFDWTRFFSDAESSTRNQGGQEA